MRITLVPALLLAGCVLGGAPTNPAQAAPVSAEATQAAPTAQQAAAAMGKGFNLGQMFDNDQHPPTLETARPKIDAYYDRGFRTLRIPVTWTEAIDGSRLADPETGAVDLDAPRLKALIQVIDYALSRPDLHVVLNAHHEERMKEAGRHEPLAQLWADIAALLQDRGPRLMFEILNEPHLENGDPMAPEVLRAMTGAAYCQISARSPERIVLIGGNQWFGAGEMARTWPDLEEVGSGSDPYLMATFHHYSPWEFAGDNQGDYADPWTEANIRDPMQVMAEWARTTGQGMPVFIGEWGVGWGSVLKTRTATMSGSGTRASTWRTRRSWASPQLSGTMAAGSSSTTTRATPSNGDLIDCIDGACAWTGEERF